MAVDISETAAPHVTDEAEGTDDGVVDKPPLESTRRGRLLISAFLVVILVALFGANMPDSVLKAGLLKVAAPVLNVTGLDQAWGVFAPNPPREANELIARVDHADGTSALRGIGATGGISEYWTYRWHKYGEYLRTNGSSQNERVALARWIADQDRAAGGVPVRVTLMTRVTPLNFPGPTPDEGPTRDAPFFTTAVTR